MNIEELHKEALSLKVDVHSYVAGKLLNKPMEEVTQKERSEFKSYGYFYLYSTVKNIQRKY